MYFAGLRPAEAAGLRENDCELPEREWGQITVTKTRSQVSKRYTDSQESTARTVYAKCIDGQRDVANNVANQRIQKALVE
ncbi:hypothetical protein NE236_11380 [Actinoallomurus purpureus]|uniref:hypothetical protein n=1 Tax=Actinoallomurus purpureus TaxID=478114 RepID=UPI002093C197|nr:hypothetical protein [Actinoallomurus purpureus]MCO6005582.1 hypothetical protein [Actinoallomurus purpureus]